MESSIEQQFTLFNMDSRSHIHEVFNLEMTSVLVKFLDTHEVFLKLALLSKHFRDVTQALKSYQRLWQDKFVQEFEAKANLTKDISEGKYEDFVK